MNTNAGEILTENSEPLLEYQLFNLSFTKQGAIEYFADNLPAHMVGIIHGQTGIHDFYLALTDFYRKTGLDPIDPIAFRTWIEMETEIHDSLGGPGGVSAFLDLVLAVEPSTPESVVKVLKIKANKRKQLDFVQQLQLLLAKKGPKTDEQVKEIERLTEQIRHLEKDLDLNPLDQLDTAGDIASRAEQLMELPDFLPTPFKSLNRAMGYCVDSETEALTERGWMKYEDIKRTDKILVFDPKERITRWEVPKSYYENYDYDGLMIQLGGGPNCRFDALVTPHHKWIVQRRRSFKLVTVQTQDLPNEGSIPRYASYSNSVECYSDDFVKLAAWYFTEGSLQKNLSTITIDQSLSVNPEYVNEIRDCLTGAGAKWRKDHPSLTTYDKRREGIWITEYTSKTDCQVFVLTGYGIDKLTQVIAGFDKVPTTDFIQNLSMRQARLFVDTALKGDGSVDKRIFYQHNSDRMDAFMHVAVLGGYGPNLSADGTACTLGLRHIDLKRVRRETVQYSGLIWCPQTEAGYWIARRNGKVYITGNTDEGGFFRGAVHAVIAPSGKGKSTFSKCLMNHWCDLGYNVLYVNFEEAQKHWETILFTQVIQENVYAHADNWSPAERLERITRFKDKLNSWGDKFMVKHDPDTSYFSDLEIWLRDLMGHNNSSFKPDVVIIDTIQSMIEKGKGQRWGEFEYMMIRLEKLAKDMDAVFIITAQQNAEAMKEKREVIKQSDTGGSITIQQKSSITIFITEKKLASGDDSVDELIMQLQIPKNRITGSTFTMDPPLVKYVDESKSYLEFDAIDDTDYAPGALFSHTIMEMGDFNL